MSNDPLSKFIESHILVMMEELNKETLSPKTRSLAVGMLRTMYDAGELRETPRDSCKAAIFNAMVYQANIAGVTV